MKRHGLSFQEAVNRAVRAGLGSKTKRRFRQRSFAMGFRPEVSYDKALQLAARLEDEELIRKLALSK